MPDYEFYCRRCRKGFTTAMSVKAHEKGDAECPSCHQSAAVEKRIAPVNIHTSKKS
jgi:putative FmdB family regulatory protein